jgi:hypothetical protein
LLGGGGAAAASSSSSGITPMMAEKNNIMNKSMNQRLGKRRSCFYI